MGRLHGKVFAVIGLFLACSLFGSTTSALAPELVMQAGNSGSSEILANIQPIRSILINDQDKIMQIISNSTVNVTPTVYKHSFSSPPIPINPNIRKQYDTILAGLDTAQTGSIYQAGPSIISQLERLASTQSILFRAQ